LRTTEDKAGLTAPCTGCGSLVTVPEASPGIDWPESQDVDPASATGDELDEFKNCPMCGEQIRARATRCRYCGENLVGRDPTTLQLQPHRGQLILGLSIGSLVMCGFCGIVGLALSITSWVMASQDLAAMDEGRMDPSGRGLTRAGRIIARIQIVLLVLGVLAYIGFIAIMLISNPNAFQ
ncbi:MAG: zinc-ribbon domain-containing protein, partial [Planctomycetaceae bacterium]